MEYMENPFQVILKQIAKVNDKVDLIAKRMDQEQPDQIGGIELASEITGYSTNTIYKKVHELSIPHIKLGQKLRFSRNELLKFVLEHQIRTVEEML